jgi:adenine-specific DNA-methyltransferase
MAHNYGEPISTATPDITAEQRARLRELFPEAFTEGKIDFDKLRAILGDLVEDGPERYQFTWAGKRDAIRLLQTPTRATLVPCREESVNFDQTQHLFIEGDNLEVLKLLYKPYFGRVKMIYIDPPYNTGNDFIYPDDYADPLATYLQLTGQQDAEGNLLTSNPETSGRYHSAWLSMMYPRLFLARQLLREDGALFVSVDDHEVHNLRLVMNEIFGEENFVECFIWKKSYGGGAKEKYAVTQHEYILLFAKNLEVLGELWLPPDPEAESRYYKYHDERGPYRLKPLEATRSMDRRENLVFPIPLPWGGEVWPERQWWWSRERVEQALASDELVFTRRGEEVTVSYKQYLYDEGGEKRGAKPFSIIDKIYTQRGTADLRNLFDDRVVIQFPKPVSLMTKLLNIGTDKSEEHIVIDFFAGSCTLAQALLELNHEDGGNRRFIMVQLPEPIDDPEFSSITDIGKERIRRVIAQMQQGGNGQLSLDLRPNEDLGFKVFKLAPSNLRPWRGVEEATSAAYVQQMKLFTDPLADGWTPENVIYEVALKDRGYGLNCRIERLGNVRLPGEPIPSPRAAVYRVTDPDREQSFVVCLADRVPRPLVQILELERDDAFVCRDAALDDETAANLALQCRLKTI